MPIARTWSEELVLEWLTLKGYLVELGLPVPLGTKSRNEADAIGVRVFNKKLEIVHVEVGSAQTGKGKEKRVKSKFAPKIVDYVENHVKEVLEWTGKTKYRKVYVATYAPSNFNRNLTKGIKVYSYKDFMREVESTMRNWEKSHIGGSGFAREFPESLWILKFMTAHD